MQDSIWLYRIYEVAKEFDLGLVQALFMKEKPTSRMRLSRVRPKSIIIENPPVSMELGTWEIAIEGRCYKGQVVARVYDLGVVSLILQIILPEDLTYEQILDLSVALYNRDDLEALFHQWRDSVTITLAGAMEPLHEGKVEEDFTLFFFRRWREDWDPVPLLLAERETVSDQMRQETMKNSFTYGLKDHAIVTWDSALVHDAEGSTDIPDLIEFALTQLVELRYYDQLLSGEMNQMYDDIDRADRDIWYSRLRQYRKIMKSYMELVIDINEVTEKIQNAIKVTEDIFYARVYAAATSILRTSVWMDSIKRKLAVIVNNYSLLNDEVVNHRSMLLELAIIGLIVFEVLMSLGEKIF
ncbi:hypothetical protein GTO91_17040 [Heliobacterium undosum]|uniref:DUF155 domain-containing protein n=1 Tax=Heliomicrobium undosum TaxID=121734 RepID=A0A845L525_9FIRM|nr:hypothetical protein [Heliomicrobium undosum]MZP31403.1 hypothetical protein [Heliomicrobium undosum]